MIDEKKLIEAFKAREMPAIDIIISVINSQPKVGEWTPFRFGFDADMGREVPTEEIPEDDQEILVTDGEDVWLDTFFNTGNLCYLDSNAVPGEEATAWMPLPEPYHIGDSVNMGKKTCSDCKHFLGMGDWELCCDLKQGLCYADTEVCELFEGGEQK